MSSCYQHNPCAAPLTIAAVLGAAPGRDTLQPYVGFHAALRSACITYVNKLEERARGLLQHHLDAATGEGPLPSIPQVMAHSLGDLPVPGQCLLQPDEVTVHSMWKQ
jgi:hypothetical protein